MQEMKYVVTESENGEKHLFVFPKCFDHDAFSEVLSYIRVYEGREWEREFRKPVSAGFTDGAECYGSSETLDLASRKEDTALLLQGGV